MDYQQALHALGQQWQSLPRGSKDSHVENLATAYGKSKSSVYTALSDAGYLPKRQARSDAGQSKCDLETAQTIANLQYQGDRQNDKVLLPLGDALGIAKTNGVCPPDLSLTTVFRVMRQHGVHPKQLRQATPHRSQRSLYPNHVWMFDVSVCVLFRLKNGKGLRAMPKQEFYKNKPANFEKIANERVLRYLVIDHYTGAFFIQYYNVPGENWQSMFDFLCTAMQRRDNDPFYGIPKILYTDKGSALTGNLRNFFEQKLNMEIIQHQAGNPRAKGAVESMHNWIERKWEGRFGMLAISNLDYLNQITYDWTRDYNAHAILKRTGYARWSLWMKIKPEQLTLAPPLSVLQQALSSKTHSRTVLGKGPSIVWENRTYYLDQLVKAGAPIRIGERLEFCFNPLEYPDIYVLTKNANGKKDAWQVNYQADECDENGVRIDAKATVIGENPQSVPDTITDIARKAMNKQAYGVDTLVEVDKARKDKQAKFEGIDPLADVRENLKDIPAFMPKRGEQKEVKPSYTMQRNALSFADALGLIAQKLQRPIQPQERKRLKTQWGEKGITENDINSIVEHLQTTSNVTAIRSA